MGGVHRIAAQDANDPRNLLCLCGSCHDETEHAETWELTEEIGWRIPAFVTDVWAVPALLHTVNYVGRCWFLLDMDGGYKWLDPQHLPALERATWRTLDEDPMDRAASPGIVSASARRIVWDARRGA